MTKHPLSVSRPHWHTPCAPPSGSSSLSWYGISCAKRQYSHLRIRTAGISATPHTRGCESLDEILCQGCNHTNKNAEGCTHCFLLDFPWSFDHFAADPWCVSCSPCVASRSATNSITVYNNTMQMPIKGEHNSQHAAEFLLSSSR